MLNSAVFCPTVNVEHLTSSAICSASSGDDEHLHSSNLSSAWSWHLREDGLGVTERSSGTRVQQDESSRSPSVGLSVGLVNTHCLTLVAAAAAAALCSCRMDLLVLRRCCWTNADVFAYNHNRRFILNFS